MGGKRSTSTSQVSIPPEVLARYNSVNTLAQDVASKPFQKYGTTAEAFVAPINEQQQAGIANVNAAAGTAQPYINAATAATGAGMASAQPSDLNIDKYMNPFQQQVIDATMKQMGQANEQAQSGALGTAVSSGAFGGDRAGIAAANLANQQGLAMGSTLAGLNAQNFGQAVQTAQQQQGVNLGATQADLARLTQGGGQLANLGVTAQQAGLQGAEAQINAGTLEQQTEQAGKTALVNQFMQEQGYPFQVAQFLANIAMGTGSLSGSTTTSTQPAPFFSDRRLKEDIKRIGKTDDGLPIYSFKYKGDEAEQTHVGFMADEVEKVKPEAVGLHPTGYKTVDYAKATENSMGGGVKPGRAGQSFADGGVAGPYGSSAGSQVDFGGYVPQAFLPVGDLIMADPAILDAARNSMAQQLASVSAIGDNVKSLDETWNWARDKWGGDEREGDVRSAEAARGVARAYGGAAYLKSQPSGGLAPNSAKTYLSDTLESQRDADKPELQTASGNGGDRKSPASDIADLGKMAMMFLGFQNGGRAGYADGGTETTEERMRRLRDMEPGAATGLLPSGRVPGADRISAPVSYGIKPSATDVSVRTPFGTRGSYNPETGLVRDSGGNYVTGREGDALRGILSGSQDQERAELATAMQNTSGVQAVSPTAENTQAMIAARKAYEEGTSLPTAGEARAAYIAPSEIAMREASPTGGLIPAAGTPLAPSGGLVPAAGTPLAPSGGLVPAAGTPFPAEQRTAGSTIADVAALPTPPTSPTAPPVGEGLSLAEPRNFFRTRIIDQESGGRQFDEDGNPLRSSAGAIGIAQVMEGTGPEAAALAGLEWDRDRWLTDPEYNAAIGEAYFLEMHRRFGSLDKAAAAYNAGPGALSSAMDRATALGGSYLDYLPSETQNYVLSTTGLGGSGGLGGAGGAGGNRDGLGRALLTSDKPYEDRNTLGKMFYNEDGTVNRNALLSLASGVGGMLASPSQFLLPSIGLGLQGAASTYAGLEKQAADIGLTKAQEDETRVRTDVSRFFTVGAGGMPMVVLGPGRSVTLDQYLSSPQLFSTGDPQQDAQILAEARERSTDASGGVVPGGAVFQSPTVQDYIQGEAPAANMDYAGTRERSAAMYANMEGAAEAARASRASLLLQTDAVASLVSPDAVVRSGALGELKSQAVRYANELLRLGGYDPISGPEDVQIAEKAALAASLDRASGGGQQSYEALNALLVANPNVQNEPEANAKLMATLMLAQQRSVDMANFAREYRNDPSNQYKLVTEAPKAFDDVYRRRYLAEEQALKTVILHGYEKPEGWPKSPMEYLMDQSLSTADRNEVIRKTLLSYGYTEDQIAPLTSAGGAIDMARYFGG